MSRKRVISVVLAGLASVAVALTVARFAGLFEARPRCTPPASPLFEGVARAEPMFGGEIFDMPVQLVQHPVEPETWYVILNDGTVERRRGTEKDVVFDIAGLVKAGQPWGLQEIALHPNFPADDRVFATYFAPGNISKVGVFRTRLDGERAGPDQPTVLFSEGQEYEWHPIGGLRFGPDGYLYIAWGFGKADKNYERQLRGKMLRIDVDRTDEGMPYAIPPDNPFIGTEYNPAVWAIGLRNPWRFNFDEATGDLWLGDVGEQGYEEIDRIVAAGDYGWPDWEGTTCRRPESCGNKPVVPPVYEHTHAEVCAPIGGFVYRGREIESLRGKYVYGDHCTGMIWAIDPHEDPATSDPVSHLGISLASFAEDREGELYVVSPQSFDENGKFDGRRGAVYKLVAATTQLEQAERKPVPSLAELGCTPTRWFPPGGMVEYGINQGAWSEGAEIRRFMKIARMPKRIGIEEGTQPPIGSIFLRSSHEDGAPVETQMLTRRKDGLWDAYVFEWNEEGTDAFVNPEASAQCSRCHNPAAGSLRAMTLSQLNRVFRGQNQIERFVDLEIFTWGGHPPRKSLPSYPRIDDESADVERRARVYLDINCSSCHQPGGQTGAANFDVRLGTPLPMTGLCDAVPNVELTGHEDARLLAPGAPAKSMISIRMHRSDLAAMPPERRIVDARGAAVVDEWIESLRACGS
jgi:glucose/arabinose dehydrogenase